MQRSMRPAWQRYRLFLQRWTRADIERLGFNFPAPHEIDEDDNETPPVIIVDKS